MNKNFAAEITANINKFMANIRRAQSAANSLKDEVTVNVNADTAAATAQISRFRAMLKSIPNKFRVRIDADMSGIDRARTAFGAFQEANDRFDNQMSSIASSIRAFGTVVQNQIQGALVASFSAAIPVIASLVPAVMAVGNALAVVGGGAIGLAGAFGIAGAGALGFGFMAKTALTLVKDGFVNATKESLAYNAAFTKYMNTWDGTVMSNQASIFNTLANGLKTFTSVLQQAAPFLSGISDKTAAASAQMLKWTESSKVASNLFKMLETTGVSVFGNILNATGRFGAGFISLFAQFGPLFSFVSQGLQSMSVQFNKWANSISTAQGIQSFINYTKTNLPVIGQIFGNTFNGIFNLFKAFGSNSQSIFSALADMSARFEQWSATIGQSQGFRQFIEYVQAQGPIVMSTIGSIVTAVMNFATAMAPIGAAVLGVISAVAQWVSAFTQAHPVVSQIVGVVISLIGVMMSLLPTILLIVDAVAVLGPIFLTVLAPIALWIAALVAVGAALVMAYQKVEWFRNAVNTFVQGWLSGVQMIIAGVQQFAAGWMAGFQMIIAGIQSFIAGWTAGVQMIINGVTTFVTGWMTGMAMIGQGITMAIALLTAFGSTVLTVMTAAWSGAVSAVTAGWSMITSAISFGVASAISFVSSGFQSMLSTASSIMSSIVSACSSAFSSVVSAISSGISSAVSIVSSGFSSMLSTASSILSSIVSAVSSAFSAVTSAISSGISAALSAVSSGFSAMVSAASSFASSLVSTITSAMSSFVSAITSGASAALSAITSMVSGILSAVRGAAGQMVAAGADLVRGFINGIQSMAGAALAAARNMAQNAVNAVRSALKIGSPSKVLKQIGQWLTQGFAIGIRKDIPKVDTAVQRMLRPVTKGLAKLKSNNYGTAKEGASSIYGFLTDNMKAATAEIEKIIDKRKGISQKIAKLNQDLRKKMSLKARVAKTSQINKLKKQYATLHNIASGQYQKRAKNRKAYYEIRPMQIYMTRIAKKREEIAARLDKAQDKLQAAIDRKTDFSNKIRDDLRGFASITSTERKTANGMRKVMANRLQSMKSYYANIERLKKMGINKSTLKDILDAGIETGGLLAKGLVKGGKSAVNQINSLQAQINSVSSKMGSKNATHFYQAGVDAARGVVNGLKSQDKQLKVVATKIADVISSTIKKRLGIHSPSRVMMDLMGYVGSGLVNGLNTAQRKVATASSQIASAIERNVKPDLSLTPFDVSGGTQDMKRSVASTFDANLQDGIEMPQQNITIVIKSEHDLDMLKHTLDTMDAVGANVNILGAS
ncbi:hypothetical protein [Macrococcus bovicus]|uniref:Phage tail tape measure protein n=1 Tax=Macrococcus bovicus TaxID=69968 RepID=A0A4R6BW49_9STAP|nr:hypothetical protein [Macrococcus bovicus]TDM12653.1 hypothetical protein ERX55_10370 [Macrococcus bovicus]